MKVEDAYDDDNGVWTVSKTCWQFQDAYYKIIKSMGGYFSECS